MTRAPPPTDHALPDWAAQVEAEPAFWADARRRAAGGPRVLVASTVGGLSALTSVESLLAAALTLRGADVHVLLCDAALPACLLAERQSVPDPGTLARGDLAQRLCGPCHATGRWVFDPLGLAVHELGALLEDGDRTEARALAARVPPGEIAGWRVDGEAVGEHAWAGTLRYFASGDLEGQPMGEAVARRYLEAALLTRAGVARLLDGGGFAAAVFNHGIYCPHGVIGEACRARGVRVVNWNAAYRKRCFLFSQGDTYHHTLLDEPVSQWEDMPWSESMERDILGYLESRRRGDRDWIWFHEHPDEDFGEAVRTLGFDPAKPLVGLLTNVMWDAQLHYRANAFPGMLDWLLRTIAWFARRPDLQLLLRVHPAEVRGTMPSRQPVLAEIARRIPSLPANVFAVPPESALSTYALMERCDSVLIYGTKTGVELSSLGIPVIVAGEAWIRNKGLTLDASSADDYFRLLERLPLGLRMSDEQVRRARRYAYHFFFRRMIPIASMAHAAEGWPPWRLGIGSLRDLLPGRDAGLDLICDGILEGSPFVYPAETLGILG